MTANSTALNRALQHALNSLGIDARLNTPDYELADRMEPLVRQELEKAAATVPCFNCDEVTGDKANCLVCSSSGDAGVKK